MFDNYYDDVILRKKTGIDKSNKPIYGNEKHIKLRYAKGKDVIYQNASGLGSKTKYVYHSPIELEIENGDMINGHTVVNTKPSHGIGGEVFFNIIEVE